MKSFDAIISLGCDCQVASQLQLHGLRKYALPFDWLLTPCITKILENKFEGFMTPDNFEFVVSETDGKYVLDKKYQTRLLHDFKMQEDFLKDYEEIAAKYDRRIERLYNIISSSDNPLFIRKGLSKEQAIVLQEIISKMRDGRSFLLTVLNDEPEPNWQLENVRNFQFIQPNKYVLGDSNSWRELFDILGLTTSNTNTWNEIYHEMGLTKDSK